MLNFSSVRLLVFCLLILALQSCASSSYQVTETEKLQALNVSETIKEYHIGVDDTVRINVWHNPELSVTVPVRPDGKISLPLIGDVQAAGLSPETVAIQIQAKLKNYIRDPNVTIMITGLASHEYLTRVRVTGAVTNQISINYRQGMTVLDAVLAAGGVNDFAAPNSTKLVRKMDESTMIYNIKLGDILYKGRLETNIYLRPGDIITVSERMF